MYVRISACMCVYVCVCARACVCACVCLRVCVYVLYMYTGAQKNVARRGNNWVDIALANKSRTKQASSSRHIASRRLEAQAIKHSNIQTHATNQTHAIKQRTLQRETEAIHKETEAIHKETEAIH